VKNNEQPEECSHCGYETSNLELFDKNWLCEVCANSVPETLISSNDGVSKQIAYSTNMIISQIWKRTRQINGG
jgi:hypothetical protein